MTRNEFIELIARSGLADASQVEEACCRAPEPTQLNSVDDARTLSNALVVAGVLTRWQANRLLEKKWKGFFLGEYKLLGLLAAAEKGQTYITEHLTTSCKARIVVKCSCPPADASSWGN